MYVCAGYFTVDCRFSTEWEGPAQIWCDHSNKPLEGPFLVRNPIPTASSQAREEPLMVVIV